MATIAIVRRHRLDPSKLAALVDEVTAELATQYQLQCDHRDDGIHFNRIGASGRLATCEQQLRLELKLGFMLKPFRAQIEQQIHRQLDQLLGENSAII
ncbi:polyhydroxyalkanoic acid system family protein [Ferrimonas senticii]|uniref:polyhydroxyalkanoic acid system family protein n=1 Tax=Ferrimonas senticii TaxID=394566 RepID=UPI00040C29AA|nr:polyhydroxyalkanoic acid system family protein [Ferrimonas senticii]